LISNDPIFKDVKMIAEAWDAAGAYQVGVFAKEHGWSEWNGKFSDTVRRFIKGTNGNYTAKMADCLSGHAGVYSNSPTQGINFVSCHDGFSLMDLVSYSRKYNEGNGEENRDGINENISWNCGAEGETDKVNVLFLRQKQIRNFMVALFFSRGIPMICMGDEIGLSRKGNNNAYCQDNELNWLPWQLNKNESFFNFVSFLIHFRKSYEVLHRDKFVSDEDITWLNKDWSDTSRFLAFILKDTKSGHFIFVAFNTSHLAIEVTVPHEHIWLQVVDTSKNPPSDFDPHFTPIASETFTLTPYSSIVLKAAV